MDDILSEDGTTLPTSLDPDLVDDGDGALDPDLLLDGEDDLDQNLSDWN